LFHLIAERWIVVVVVCDLLFLLEEVFVWIRILTCFLLKGEIQHFLYFGGDGKQRFARAACGGVASQGDDDGERLRMIEND
jgi:hypothetical protein